MGLQELANSLITLTRSSGDNDELVLDNLTGVDNVGDALKGAWVVVRLKYTT